MKKIFNSRVLALILVLAMAVSLFTLSVSAVTNVSLSGHGSNIASIVATGADFEEIEYAVSTDTHGTVYDYYLTVPADTADGTVLTATFTAAADQDSNFVISKLGQNIPNPPRGVILIRQNASNTYTATMTEGAALATAYAHKDVVNEFGKCDTYNFHYHLPYPVSISTGDPVFIGWSGNNGTVSGREGTSRIPGEFTLWVEGSNTITVDGATVASSYSNEGNYAFAISTKTSGNTVITAVSKGETYTITCGPKSHTPAGSAPTRVTGYMPIGQFANYSGWGYIGSGFAGKTAPESTGISLGAFGGFAEFYFENGIADNPTNPYGVDFVIYGNAFNGNPEAGAVQVGVVTVDGNSETFYKWYELAGSNYYKNNFSYDTEKAKTSLSNIYSGTKRNTTVTYERVSTGTSKIDVSLAGNPAVRFVNNERWWPLTKNYQSSFNSQHMDSVVNASYTGEAVGSKLTFNGITAIADSNTTDDYAFGYVDVTPNGSPATYGEAVNPYLPYHYTDANGNEATKTGGDGFDLAWAVDIETGEPVNLSALGSDKVVKYVRVYSAVLDVAQFGETSTEITGIFTATGTSSNTNPTPRAVAKLAGTTISTTGTAVSSTQRFISRTVTAGTEQTLSISSSADYLYVNGVQITGTSNSNPYTISVNLAEGETATYQVITQTGTRQPYIEVIKLTGSAATRSMSIGE